MTSPFRSSGLSRSALWIGAAVLVLVVIAAFRVSTNGPVPLSLTGPSAVEAGEVVEIAVSTPGNVSATAEVTVVAGPREQKRQVPLLAGRGALVLDDLTTSTGRISVMAASHEGIVIHELVVRPGSPASVRLLVSAETLAAQSSTGDTVEATAIVTDKYGNAVADGTLVRVLVDDSDGVETLAGPTNRGVATFSVPVAPKPGTLTLAAISGNAISPDQQVVRLPGPAENITLQLAEPSNPLLADGQTRYVFTSDLVVDATGTSLPDGMAVSLQVDGPTGPGLVTGRISNGRVHAVMQAPMVAGLTTVTPVIGPVVGQSLTLNFTAEGVRR